MGQVHDMVEGACTGKALVNRQVCNSKQAKSTTAAKAIAQQQCMHFAMKHMLWSGMYCSTEPHLALLAEGQPVGRQVGAYAAQLAACMAGIYVVFRVSV